MMVDFAVMVQLLEVAESATSRRRMQGENPRNLALWRFARVEHGAESRLSGVSSSLRSGKLAQRRDIVARAVAQPTVELGHVFELLAALSRYREELDGDVLQRRHIPPQLFELGDGEHVFLRVA